jgi:hypothetical protein
MEIVPTTPRQPKQTVSLDNLLIRKAELKSEIANQKTVISNSVQRAFSLESLTSYAIGSITKQISLIDSAIWGFKVASKIKSFFGKK